MLVAVERFLIPVSDLNDWDSSMQRFYLSSNKKDKYLKIFHSILFVILYQDH